MSHLTLLLLSASLCLLASVAQSITKATDEPIAWSHFTAEGEVEFRSILYIPGA